MSVETISRRYATALADVVLKTGETETVRSELRTWEQLFVANSDLKTAFGNPVIPHARKTGLLEGLLAKAKPSQATANFLRVLLANGRMMDLRQILERFEAVLEERSGVISAEVASAHELSESQRNELKANLEKQTGKQVKLGFAIDANLIGGVVTRIGSTVYDGSVKTQLENLKEELIGS
ncbi:MAG: F0F1 ATP synthase subunit delta [Acidobacteria bacterium]|nr:MAG: F0F1 ATP synthase subunit delta [Acidobacteriota bacterium]